MNRPRTKLSTAIPPTQKVIDIALSTDVYLEAQKLSLDISQLCEQKLREEIRARKDRQWNEQHADFISAYNKAVETESLALQEWRTF